MRIQETYESTVDPVAISVPSIQISVSKYHSEGFLGETADAMAGAEKPPTSLGHLVVPQSKEVHKQPKGWGMPKQHRSHLEKALNGQSWSNWSN